MDFGHSQYLDGVLGAEPAAGPQVSGVIRGNGALSLRIDIGLHS
jgi:hypothetical protein